MKNAIGMIIFNNELYVVGACISAFVHKQYIKESNLNIDLIVMVDNKIYNSYKNELEEYFDKVILIQLIEMKLNPEYKIINKYSKWMKYSINKWQILNQDDYDKILFIDIDILPINKDFYNIFEINTPAILIRGINNNFNQIIKKNLFTEKDNFLNNEFFYASKNFNNSLDAGLILLKPNKNLYKEYINFLSICEGKNGYISKYDSGIDETTLLLFFMFYKNINLYGIPYDYAVIPWDKFPYNKDHVKAINYLSMIKPWTKLPMIQWADENIWHVIIKKAFKKDSILTSLYLRCLINNLYIFYKNYKYLLSKHNSPYNMECLKNKKISSKTFELFNYLKKHNENELTIEQIEKIILMNVEIHKLMDKKKIINL